MPSSNFINATDARRDFFDLLAKVKKSTYPFAIVHKGIPEGILMSWDEYNGMIATMETLSDPEMVEAIRKGDADIAAGRYQTLDQVEKELELGKYKKHVSSHSPKSSKKRSKKN